MKIRHIFKTTYISTNLSVFLRVRYIYIKVKVKVNTQGKDQLLLLGVSLQLAIFRQDGKMSPLLICACDKFDMSVA